MKTKSNLRTPTGQAYETFSDLMIRKIESIGGDWEKPWFTEGALQLPRNLSGRRYTGVNMFMLMWHCEKQGYDISRFCTFNALERMNDDEKAKEKGLPLVHVLKGAKSFPVVYISHRVYHDQTMEEIPFESYLKMSLSERDAYRVQDTNLTHRVFNVRQTNLKEVRPELWAKLEEDVKGWKKRSTYLFAPLDNMIANGTWVCPIYVKHQDEAFYSVSSNSIVIPEKSQFKDETVFYGTLLHEMAHSTGTKDVLNRHTPCSFNSEKYAEEELVAELTSAMVMQSLGLAKTIKKDSATYLKAWIKKLQRHPMCLKGLLADVQKATDFILGRIDAQGNEEQQVAA